MVVCKPIKNENISLHFKVSGFLVAPVELVALLVIMHIGYFLLSSKINIKIILTWEKRKSQRRIRKGCQWSGTCGENRVFRLVSV